MICLLVVSVVTGSDESRVSRSSLISSLNHDVLLWLLLLSSSCQSNDKAPNDTPISSYTELSTCCGNIR